MSGQIGLISITGELASLSSGAMGSGSLNDRRHKERDFYDRSLRCALRAGELGEDVSVSVLELCVEHTGGFVDLDGRGFLTDMTVLSPFTGALTGVGFSFETGSFGVNVTASIASSGHAITGSYPQINPRSGSWIFGIRVTQTQPPTGSDVGGMYVGIASSGGFYVAITTETDGVFGDTGSFHLRTYGGVTIDMSTGLLIDSDEHMFVVRREGGFVFLNVDSGSDIPVTMSLPNVDMVPAIGFFMGGDPTDDLNYNLSEFCVASFLSGAQDHFVIPPTWTQHDIGLRHAYVISPLSSSDHEVTNNNAQGPGGTTPSASTSCDSIPFFPYVPGSGSEPIVCTPFSVTNIEINPPLD